MDRGWQDILHQAAPQLEHSDLFEGLGSHAESSFPSSIARIYRRFHLGHDAFENRTIRVSLVWPNQGVPCQLDTVRYTEHNAKARWVTYCGRIGICQGIQIHTPQLLQHKPGQIHIIDIKRTNPARPQDHPEVLRGSLLPKRFGSIGVGVVTTRLVPTVTLWTFLTWFNRNQGKPKVFNVVPRPCSSWLSLEVDHACRSRSSWQLTQVSQPATNC